MAEKYNRPRLQSRRTELWRPGRRPRDDRAADTPLPGTPSARHLWGAPPGRDAASDESQTRSADSVNSQKGEAESKATATPELMMNSRNGLLANAKETEISAESCSVVAEFARPAGGTPADEKRSSRAQC